MNVLGLDVGGAHIKVADTSGYTCHQPFPLWQRHTELSAEIRRLLHGAPGVELVAMTMTGELTDCFRNKREGVAFICDAVAAASDRPVVVYLVGDEFVEPEMAKARYLAAAASNWYGLATWVSRMGLNRNKYGWLIDVGSTTTDIVPFLNGHCIAHGTTDAERLESGELVYTGAVRSSLAGIVRRLNYRGKDLPVMNELYATMLDVNIVLGDLEANSTSEWAADQKGTSIAECTTRIGRLLGMDDDAFQLDDARAAALQIREQQLACLCEGAAKVVDAHGWPEVIFVSGQGEFTALELARRVAHRQLPLESQPDRLSSLVTAEATQTEIEPLSDLFDPHVSRSATARAIAELARDWKTPG